MEAQTHTATAIVPDAPKIHVAIEQYADRTLVLVNQLKRIGSLIQVSQPPPTAQPLPLFPEQIPTPDPSTTTTTLLGPSPTEVYELYATHIATLIYRSSKHLSTRPVVVGLSLVNSNEDGDHVDHDEAKLEQERTRFLAVLDATRRCLNAS